MTKSTVSLPIYLLHFLPFQNSFLLSYMLITLLPCLDNITTLQKDNQNQFTFLVLTDLLVLLPSSSLP